MATLLAQKSGTSDNVIAKNDDHHDLMANDPTVTAVPQGTAFGGINNGEFDSSGGTSAFGSPSTGGFGATSSDFGAISGSSGNSSFGAPASGFGSNTQSNTGTVQMIQNQGESLKSGGGAMSEGGESTVALDKDSTDWINKKMRPMMGWVYMMTCTCDFVIFPILWSLLQALSHGQVTSQWQPLTLQGAGLYHIAMGAVLGIAAYGRTKEKIAGAA
jgi:hypothetical protein